MDIPRYNNNNLHDFLLANKYKAQDYGKRCRTICHQILSNLSVLSIYIHLKLFYTRTCITIHTLIARLIEDLFTNSISGG
jgi:hypothetical protein